MNAVKAKAMAEINAIMNDQSLSAEEKAAKIKEIQDNFRRKSLAIIAVTRGVKNSQTALLLNIKNEMQEIKNLQERVKMIATLPEDLKDGVSSKLKELELRIEQMEAARES